MTNATQHDDYYLDVKAQKIEYQVRDHVRRMLREVQQQVLEEALAVPNHLLYSSTAGTVNNTQHEQDQWHTRSTTEAEEYAKQLKAYLLELARVRNDLSRYTEKEVIEARMRDANPSVKDAWEKYQTVLRLVGNDSKK